MLCALTLVIVVSALSRLHLYEEAFGFTRLRLFMNAFETWLGVLVVLVLLAGIRLRARVAGRVRWSPPPAQPCWCWAPSTRTHFVAERNVDRYLATGKLDVGYLQALSADAVPAVDRLPEPVRSCVLLGMSGGFDGSAGSAGRRRRCRRVQRLEPGPGPGRRPARPAPGRQRADLPHLTSGARDISCLCQTRYIVNGETPCRSGG